MPFAFAHQKMAMLCGSICLLWTLPLVSGSKLAVLDVFLWNICVSQSLCVHCWRIALALLCLGASASNPEVLGSELMIYLSALSRDFSH